MRSERAIRFWLEFCRIQIVACSFAFSLIACLAVSRFVRVPFVPRYDLILIFCLAIQVALVWRRVETWRDIGVVALFHVTGVLLEWNKVRAGSWSYPEFAYLKFNGVPLYGGFMYAAVASYMIAAWKLFDLRFENWPRGLFVGFILAAVYGQFFIPVQLFAIRLAVLALLATVFARCSVAYTVNEERRRMRAPTALLLIGFFVWLAENIATYFGAWTYPYQVDAWQPVHISKVISWTMLMVVSLSIIQYYKTMPFFNRARLATSQTGPATAPESP